MIPLDYITEWRTQAPWSENFQVEQDLVISRALVEIFSAPVLAGSLAFRGGTALHKLYLTPPARYSEDIDLVQIEPGPAGPMMDALRNALDPWLGEAQWKQSQGRVTFGYRFLSEDIPAIRLRVKVEINTREHFSLLNFTKRLFSVESRWYSGHSEIKTFELDELLATKMRALYQRRKGRDLFDLLVGLRDERSNPRQIVAAFREYMNREGNPVSRAMFEQNLAEKVDNAQFNADMSPLIRIGFEWRLAEAARIVSKQLISLLPGEPWKQ
ncbi:MAG: nucleotidyl transferase AbiEii/AbiGii toxin family protein [Gammaproteobacteria bacterium]|nr:nucleotidyl transferase AbiEii/AbiGii toxin family protein [Gammaproteobacteria bacterium]MCY4313843.1 nucleotidyl transferase AbiEii/AbiGii toxin family protein [Gammaproteobacteria bacterium]